MLPIQRDSFSCQRHKSSHESAYVWVIRFSKSMMKEVEGCSEGKEKDLSKEGILSTSTA
ncbi:hypothetical protein I3843_02G175000 [Carya illinoinensis]|nr:hypothetical protein I3843_02G175000 [Carya illinoinensis]